jgi:hypothetical protein
VVLRNALHSSRNSLRAYYCMAERVETTDRGMTPLRLLSCKVCQGHTVTWSTPVSFCCTNMLLAPGLFVASIIQAFISHKGSLLVADWTPMSCCLVRRSSELGPLLLQLCKSADFSLSSLWTASKKVTSRQAFQGVGLDEGAKSWEFVQESCLYWAARPIVLQHSSTLLPPLLMDFSLSAAVNLRAFMLQSRTLH